MIDIVFPNKNESAFIKVAEQLGYKALIFAYKGTAPKQYPKTKLKILTASEYDGKTNKGGLVISKNNAKARHYIEQSPASLIYALEESQTRDFMHHRGSGLNQVLCKLLKQKKKAYGFSLASILKNSGKKRAELIGRMEQNWQLCKKYGVPIVLGSFATHPLGMRSWHDIQALFLVLGMPPKQVKEAQNSLKSVLKP